jgi:anion-transporting  ArsA/GET3 family ATPase
MSDGAAGHAERTAVGVFDELARRTFVVVSGKGGVGRTTVAALCGLALADRGRRVLVATTGHDDRLAWMLGADSLSEAPTPVEGGLSIVRLSAPACIREYGALVLRSSRLSTAVFDNRIVSRLMRAIPGLDDFSLVGKAWHDAFRGGDYDTVVFDGPATGHLLYTLGVPRAIRQTIAPGPLTREAELMCQHFEDRTRTAALLVGLPERWPLTELDELGVALGEQVGIGVAAVVVNGLWPSDVAGVPTLDPDAPGAAVLDAVAGLAATGRRHDRELAAWVQGHAKPRAATLTLPWRFDGVGDRRALRELLASFAAVRTYAEAGT